MTFRCIMVLLWAILLLSIVNVGFSGNANHAFSWPYNFIAVHNPVSVFEVQGPREINKFTSGGLYRARINENAGIGSYVRSPVKMGLYIPETDRKVEYILRGISRDTQETAANCLGTKMFGVNVKRIENFYALQLITKRMLSEESCKSYLLTVQAQYSDGKRTIDTTKVLIEVQVSSNLDTHFEKPNRSESIPLNFPPFQPILQLHTANRDKHDVGKVYFSLTQQSKYFELDPVNGVLFLKRSLPVGRNQHDLMARVRRWDSKFSRKTLVDNSCTITIKVEAVNQYSPLITLDSVIHAVENKASTILARITVSDLDEGKNGMIESLIISSGDEHGYFRLEKIVKNSTVFHLRLAKPLGPKLSKFSLTLTATDQGIPPKSSTIVHRIKLEDFSSNKPHFPVENYHVNISEMMPVNSTVIKLNPWNLNPSSRLSYSIVHGDPSNMFRMKSDTGEINVAKTLDAETTTLYILKIALNVISDEPAVISCNIHVHVEDFNDHAPKFTADTHYVEIQEDMAPHTSIYKVEAKDGDSGDNGLISYWLPHSSQFSIHPKTGVISVRQVSDRDSGTPEYAYVVVRAGDSGTPIRREAETMVKIRIKAWNDNGPVVKQNDCTITLSPDVPVGTKLLQIQAIDIDVNEKSKPSFLFSIGSDVGYFKLDSTNGDLTVAKSLADARNSYSLVIVANDGTHKSANSAFLKITIDPRKPGKDVSCTDSSAYIKALKLKTGRKISTSGEPIIDRTPPVNSHAPRFADREKTITIPEDIAIGSVLGTFKATDHDDGYEGLLTYYLVGGNVNQCFHVDSLTGELKTTAQLDREQVSKYELNMSVWDSGISRKVDFIKVIVIVADLNDNAPVFDNEIYNISISENIPVGQTVLKIHANDSDEGANQKVAYQLINNNKYFFIDYNSGDLILNKPLDFEKEKLHKLKVLALDGSSINQHVSQANVILNVLDENDNPPIINPVRQDIFVMRDLPVQSPITQVTAVDPDSGASGTLSFTLATSLGSELFSIDSKTGLMNLKSSLASTTVGDYNLTVIVSDNGQPHLWSKALVNIHVVQRVSNEDMQIFSSHGGIDEYSVPENAPAGYQVTKLTRASVDSEIQNSFLFSIIDGTDITMFNLAENSDILTTTASLDHEEIPYYWMTIQVVARQSRQFYKNIHLLIRVQDTNDNYPIFYPPVYESKVPENTKADEIVVNVSASDRDSGENGKLTYSIIGGNDEGHFKIDHVTGLISTTDLPLDYEREKVYQLVVSVADNGSKPKATQAWVRVIILDENDNLPEFKENLDVDFLISGTSTVPKNTLLTQLLASDKDEGDNGDLTFNILSGNQDGKLRIDPKSGLLYSNDVLNSFDAFQLEVQVKDNGHQALSAKTVIDITVTDHVTFGPNPPTFQQKQVNISLAENTAVGHQIDIIPATDKDGDILVYSIKAGNEDQKFQINRHGKSLKLIAELGLTKPSVPLYHLVISATDGLYTSDYMLNIFVQDINDHYPMPEMIEKIASVSETVQPGTRVVTVKATDHDFGVNAQIIFSLKSAVVSKSLKLFDIDPTAGEITVKAGLDYEDMSSHVLIVAMTDRGDQPKQSLMYVVVNVLDVNEWSPEFIKPSHHLVVQENTPPGSDVVKVLAKDKDRGLDAALKYSIISGNHGFAFTIRPESGVIQTNRVFKAAQISEYVLTVETRDDGSHGLSATTNVTVKLLSRGNRPGFAKNPFTASIYENQPINTFVESAGFGGLKTFYTIVRETECANGFQISQFSGTITTQRVLDAEKISNCSFRIKAEDGDGFSQESKVMVEIKDLNDNHPLMQKKIFLGYVNENAKEKSVVLNEQGQPLVIAARDVDVEPQNRELKFELINPGIDNYFQLDENTGALLTSKFNIDYEVEQSYIFLVKVSDKGSPSLSDAATIVVHVKNINDVAPQFSKAIFEVLVYLPTYEGVHVTTVTAFDRDQLGNITFSISQQDTASLLTIDASSGRVTIGDPSKAKKGWYNAKVEVNDGMFSRRANLRVMFKPIPVSSLQFLRPSFQAHVRENASLVQPVFTPVVIGYKIRDRIKFRLRNLQDKFTIKESTGVIKTKAGIILDREHTSSYHLLIIAQDDNTPPRMARSVIVVIVDDVNDCKPTFPPPPIFFVASKSSAEGSTVATITASDCDDGKNGEIRYHIKSDKSRKFGIDYNTGALKVLSDLVGLTTSTEFKLIIEAKDLGEKSLRSEAEVSVRIEPGDACIFEKPSYRFELAEDATVGKVFERLHARCPKGKPVFTIMSGDNFSQFACDLNTGELSLTSALDFETTSSYPLVVRAKDSNTGASSTATVSILVKDINDNPPTFHSSLYFARIKENSPEGSILLRLDSNDLDSGENQRRYYEIVKDDGIFPGMFAIDKVTGALSMTKRVDYEKNKDFSVTVRVSDHGQPPLSSKALIKVFVTDVNDNAPRFQKSHYRVTVLGNAGPSLFITQVLATDEDETDFLNLRYRIVSGIGNKFFLVNVTSGVVSLSKVPGLVLGKVYSLKLSVNDSTFTAYTTLDVVVGQTNNHAPVFSQDLIHAEVTENYPADSYVAMVTATDQDSGDFGEVVYAIESKKAAQDFKVDDASGIITTRKPLDREVMDFITIPIRATDRGGKSTFCNVQVTILDENDNQPQFLMPAYTAVVSVIQASVGENVLKVTAVDRDEGENSALTYGLVGQTSPFVFGINSTSGVISFLRKPRESVYNFYVRVNDNGHLKLKSYVQVQVSVRSLVFQFKLKKYSVSISETVQGNVHQKFQLIDNNGALVTSNVDYSVQFGTSLCTNKLGTFSVNSLGELVITRNLDYETIHSYELVVTANRSSFFAYATVHIEVLDENDNTPEFEANLYVTNIPEDSPNGTSVVQVRAHDKDSKENGLITYELSAESKKLSNAFIVDKHTGWITTNGPLDRETVPSYLLQIDAKDHGRDKQFVSSTHVNISLDDVNDSPPVFSKNVYMKSIKEDSPTGSEVLTLSTTDKDTNSQIVYYIVTGDPHNQFNIDQTSGKIYVNEKLDREFLPRYLLNITASDGAFISSTLVKIEVIDVNDNKPICHSLNWALSISEDINIGTPIATVNATDRDVGNNSRITFAIFSHHEKFSIDDQTGVIKVDHSLDREKKSSYNFVVSASDGRSACYTNITIELLDVNDNPPKFTKSHYTKPVAIDSEVNSVLLRVEATDKDEGLNRKVSYALKNASEAFPFSIEKETGIISLKTRLLSLDKENFNFNVLAMDNGVPSLSSEAAVEIVVSSVKNCPFVKDEYRSEISEDTEPTYNIEPVLVTCSGGKFNISYKITDEDQETHRLFAINENTGMLSLKEALDYEMSRLHIFTVEALMVKPSGKTILVSSTSVKIKVTDCNDNKPVFNKKSYNATVDEDSAKKSLVIALFAADNDTSNKITYTIIKSLPDATKFMIDAVTGMITVKGSLDREERENYELLVRAQDNGNPPLFSDAQVFIRIKDLNDNPPVVQKKITKLVSADAPVGTVVLQLKPTDADGPLNSKPFKFSILSGGNDMFMLNSSGVLKTKRRLSLYNAKMTIRTTDSGTPPMFSDTSVEITVVKHSLNSPEVRPVSIYVNMLAGSFKGGIIGKVVAHDPDRDDVLQYSLVKGNAKFSVGPTDGTIRVNSVLDRHSYSFEVQVTDGTHKVNAQVSVQAKEITPEVVDNSVTVRIASKTLSSFVSSSLSVVINTLASLMYCSVDEVYLWSIQMAPGNGLDVVFAIKKPGRKDFFNPNHLRETLEDQLENFQKSCNVVVSSIGIFPCDERQCSSGKECRNKIKVLNKWGIFSSNTTTFLSYKNEQDSDCICPEGQSGSKCLDSVQTKCRENPCKPGFQCIDRPTGYECICPKGKNCQEKCRGDECYADAMTFNGNSYIRYSLIDEKSDKLSSFSVSVRTTKPSGTIFSAKGAYDYFILEVVEGKVRVRFNYGSGEGIGRIDQVKINDGKWYNVKVTRKKRQVRLMLNPGNYMAEAVALGSMRFLNVDMNNIIVGAELPRRSIRSMNAVSNGYFGCMQNPRLNGKDLPLSGSSEMAKATAQGVSPNCAVCNPSFCQNDGQCKVIEQNGYKVPSCRCKPGFTGYDCSEDVNECDLLPCKNSGVCVNIIGSFKCDCLDRNFEGSLCQTSVSAVSRPEPLGTMEFIYIGATVFVLIIIAIIIACACRCVHKRRRKAKARRYSHERLELKIKETDHEVPLQPPPPPPRRGDVEDPPTAMGSRVPSWDYADVPEMVPRGRKISESSSFASLPLKSFDDLGEYSGTNGIPQIPKRPRRISETQNIPDVPEKPTQYRCSRASSQSSVHSRSLASVSEIGEEGLDIIRQGRKDIDELVTKAADVVDNIFGTKCASPPSECDTQSECSQVDTEIFSGGHLETYDASEVAYFIPENDQDTTNENDSEDETSTMLQKLPNVKNSEREVLHKESNL